LLEKDGNGILGDSMGLGKAQPLFCNILTPGGFKKMGDVKPGDEIINSLGGRDRVLKIFPQGVKPYYSIYFSNGSKTYATKEHLWRVFDKKNKSERVLQTREIMKDPKRYGVRNVSKVIRLNTPEKKYKPKELDRIGEIMKSEHPSFLSEDIKFSPDREFFLNSFCDFKKGLYFFKTTTQETTLREDLKFIIGTLGWVVQEKVKNGIITTTFRKDYKFNSFEDIFYEGETECQCISVSSHDKCYITDDFILTHNTIQAIGLINNNTKIKKVLIVCPSALKYNWVSELERWLIDREFEISVLSSLEPYVSDITIASYDLLARNERIVNKICKNEFDLVIADEAHRIKNEKTKSYLALEKISEKTKRVLLVTGSPLINRPAELYTLLKLIKNPLAFDWKRYVFRYCNAYIQKNGGGIIYRTTGFSNELELSVALRATCMLRRLKKDVEDLLPKVKKIYYVDLPKKEKDLLVDEQEEYKQFLRYDNSLFKARSELAERKIDCCLEAIQDALELTDKVVFFSYHRCIIDAVQKKFDPISVQITGTETAAQIRENVEKFQTDPKIKLLNGSIKTAREGLTLTKANLTIFGEIDWTPGGMEQAEDRTHRIGQERQTYFWYVIVKNSIDEKILEMVQKKEIGINKILN